jgi:hypothetical protein
MPVEMQLAHDVTTKSAPPTNSAQWLSGRRKMLGWWSDYLDSAKVDGELILERPLIEEPARQTAGLRR